MKKIKFLVFSLFFCSALFSQTVFTVTDNALGNAGSLDKALTNAVNSANQGNNVTIFFKVNPDFCGSSLCRVDKLLPDCQITNGSILLTADPASVGRQGIAYLSSSSFTKIFKGKGKKIQIKNLAIIKLDQATFCVLKPYAKLERSLTGVNYAAINGQFSFYYDEEYTAGSFLQYKVYNASDEVVLSSSNNPISLVYGDNRCSLPMSSLSSGTYILEVINTKKEKFYLRFTKP